jgi:hypothetical protein
VGVGLFWLDVQEAQGRLHDELVEGFGDLLHQAGWGAAEAVVHLGDAAHAEKEHGVLHSDEFTIESTEEGRHGQGGLPSLLEALDDVLIGGSDHGTEDDGVAGLDADLMVVEGVTDVGREWVGVFMEVEEQRLGCLDGE